MVKFVLDADAAIKLAKAGVLETLTSFSKCSITKQVYQEILKGKDKMYEDAFEIERLVGKGKIFVSEVKAQEVEGLGIGECSSLEIFQKIKVDAIISDDRKFLSVLEAKKIPFIIPTDIIAMLSLKKCISKNDALGALDRMRLSVSEDSYNSAKRIIGGK
ncbi:hypothetical protein HYY72_02410 [Candidatus Woesearchaeota archaeon]|nr:hypothetical protein [Candidatus Woesearchaeota archaeon]